MSVPVPVVVTMTMSVMVVLVIVLTVFIRRTGDVPSGRRISRLISNLSVLIVVVYLLMVPVVWEIYF